MVKVTDKDLYLNQNLKSLLDLLIKRKDRKWDNVIIIDGKERSGKSTLAKAIAYYYAHTIGKQFTVDNIFFSPEDMLNYATSTEEQVIIWDEAAMGGLSTQWQNQIQQKLTTMLMVTGKYRHFYIFIIPSFFRLSRYLAIDRSIALLHVYSPDMLARGGFFCLNESEKTWVYNQNRKSETYGKNSSFNGSFTFKNTDKIVDEIAYEKKKDAAIQNELHKHGDKSEKKLHELQYKIATKLGASEGSKKLDIPYDTIKTWGYNGEKWGFTVDIERN